MVNDDDLLPPLPPGPLPDGFLRRRAKLQRMLGELHPDRRAGVVAMSERIRANLFAEAVEDVTPPRSRWRIALDLVVRVLLFVIVVAMLSALAACDREAALEPGPLRVIAFDALDPGTFGGDDPMPELSPEIVGACELLELDCTAETDRDATRGALVLLVTDSLFGGTQDGTLLVSTRCERASWSTAHAARIAHEIGRAFGLAPSDDPGNVMHTLGRVAHVEAEQLADVDEAVRDYVGGCS